MRIKLLKVNADVSGQHCALLYQSATITDGTPEAAATGFKRNGEALVASITLTAGNFQFIEYCGSIAGV